MTQQYYTVKTGPWFCFLNDATVLLYSVFLNAPSASEFMKITTFKIQMKSCEVTVTANTWLLNK